MALHKTTIQQCDQALITQRNEARASKDWAAADAARDELTRMGIVLEDTAQGTLWRRQ